MDGSPRKRHHIRFWALNVARADETLGSMSAATAAFPESSHCAPFRAAGSVM